MKCYFCPRDLAVGADTVEGWLCSSCYRLLTDEMKASDAAVALGKRLAPTMAACLSMFNGRTVDDV